MISEYLKDGNNSKKIRAVGFGMAVMGMLVGIVVAVVAGATGNTPLGACAAGFIVLSFALLPVTDVNFPKSRYL